MEKSYTLYNFWNNTPDWGIVPKLFIDEFPWYEQGTKQETQVQVALSHETIYIRVHAVDQFIRQDASILNEPVYNDSCFEFFVTPQNAKGESYFNIEMSCNGTLYLAYKDNTEERTLISKEEAEKVKIESRVEDDKGWTLEVALPLSVLEKICGYKIKNDIWYGNFYRCGGKIEQQYACWNAIEYDFPSFHQPNQFGKITILSI